MHILIFMAINICSNPSSVFENNAPQPDCVCVLSWVQLFCGPMDCSLPGSSIHEHFQARILEWITISYSSGSYHPRDRTHVSCVFCIGRRSLYHWATSGKDININRLSVLKFSCFEEQSLFWRTSLFLLLVKPNPPQAMSSQTLILNNRNTVLTTGFSMESIKITGEVFKWEKCSHHPHSNQLRSESTGDGTLVSKL